MTQKEKEKIDNLFGDKEQIESIYEKLKVEYENLKEKKKNAKSYDVEKEIIQEIEKLNIEITLLEVILEK